MIMIIMIIFFYLWLTDRPLKLTLCCEVVEKRWHLGPVLADTPDFGHIF